MTSEEATKIAETAALAAVGVGSAVLFVVNKRFRRGFTDALNATTAQKQKTVEPPPPVSASPTSSTSGSVVYLLKAGPFFKIGKASDFGRRLRQIKLQLPYPVETVHTIQCSDISSVETYWHRRFVSRRQNGEWFVLTDEDVREFKRYTVM